MVFMDAVVIGVSDRTCLWRHGNINNYGDFVRDYALLLAELFDNILVTPDDGVYSDVALAFGKVKGRKPIGYYPDKDSNYGIEHIRGNFGKYELRPIEGDWYKLNAVLTSKSHVVISLGLSPGVFIEGSYIKYHQKYGGLGGIHWLIDERCIGKRLPTVFEEQISNIFYYNELSELREILTSRSLV